MTVVAPARTERRVQRSALLGWLVAVACVVVAALGLQLSDPRGDVQTVAGLRNEPVPFYDGTVSVGVVRVGQGLQDFESVTPTLGMFVTVEVTLSADGTRKRSLSNFELLSGERVYTPYESAILSVQPGFAQTATVAFEVDPARIDDLTLQASTTEIVTAYHQQVRVHLGITSGNAQAWRMAAAGQVLETARTTTSALR